MQSTVRIKIINDAFDADAEDTILFALQRYAQAKGLPVYGFTRFCWNASCGQCVLKMRSGGVTCRDFACQTPVEEDMELLSLPEVLHWPTKVKSGL
jgi:succinate dehydrogenase/fumarate reductase-like Fe-S protein